MGRAGRDRSSERGDPLDGLADLLGARDLLLAVLTEPGGRWRFLRLGRPAGPAGGLSAWLGRPETWSLPVHTLLDAPKLDGTARLDFPPGSRLVLLTEYGPAGSRKASEPLAAILFEPGATRPAALSAEALETARRLAREGRLEARLDAERALREATTRILDEGLIAVDPAGRITRFEGAAERILGVAAAEAVGRPVDEILRPADLERSPLRAALKGTVDRIDLYVLDRDGREVPVSMGLGRVVDSIGAVAGAVAVFRDISEERALAEAARRRDRLASIGELAAGVAHEIRNPLTGIHNCAQVLRDRFGGDPKALPMIEIILKEGDRLNRIVQSLLSFARPGRPRLRPERLEACVDGVLELEAKGLVERGIEVSKGFAEGLPEIYIDPDQIRQVLLNVVRNAAEAMPGGGTLRAEVRATRRHPHRRRGLGRRTTDRVRHTGKGPVAAFLRARIEDSGPGIPEDVLSKIFDPFFTTRSEGTGLGLSISQSIVQEHGGFIQIHSAVGRGTAVEIDLPVERRRALRSDEDPAPQER